MPLKYPKKQSKYKRCENEKSPLLPNDGGELEQTALHGGSWLKVGTRDLCLDEVVHAQVLDSKRVPFFLSELCLLAQFVCELFVF